ncbi:unnamed protein product [Effrenium voratum]|nr:unnamed protein product [Effrenium voratum]
MACQGPVSRSNGQELRRLRQQAAQCQEFKEMSEQANSELVRVEGEVHRLKEQLARVSRQNKQLLLQLRQQRMSHRQELRLHATSKEDGKDVSLLTYLQDAPEHQDTQLQKDLATHSAEVRLCLRKAMRQVLLDHLTLEDPTVEALQSHVRELWASMHSLWRAELLEDIVEDIFHKVPSLCRGSPTSEADEPQWPEVAEQAEKQVLQMLERLSFVDISPGRESLRTRRAPAPPTSADTGSEDRDAAGETEMAPAKEVSPARSKRVSGEKPATPSFGSPWRRPSRSPSPTLRHAPSMPAVLIAGPVLKPARQRPQAVVVEVAPAPKRLSQGAVEIAQVVTKTYVKNVEVRGLLRDRQNSEPNSQDFGNTKPFGTVLSYLTFGVYECEIYKKSNELYIDFLSPGIWAKVHYPLNRLEVNLLDNDQVLIILEELLRDPGKGDLESQRRPGGLMLMRKSPKADEQFSQRLPLLLEENKEIYRKAQLSLILAQNFPDSRRTSRMKPTKETMVIGDGRDPGGVVANINGALISGVAVVMILIQKIQMTTMIPTYHGTSQEWGLMDVDFGDEDDDDARIHWIGRELPPEVYYQEDVFYGESDFTVDEVKELEEAYGVYESKLRTFAQARAMMKAKNKGGGSGGGGKGKGYYGGAPAYVVVTANEGPIPELFGDDVVLATTDDDSYRLYGVIDSGATETVGSLLALENIMETRRSLYGPEPVYIYGETNKSFRFGNGDQMKTDKNEGSQTPVIKTECAEKAKTGKNKKEKLPESEKYVGAREEGPDQRDPRCHGAPCFDQHEIMPFYPDP